MTLSNLEAIWKRLKSHTVGTVAHISDDVFTDK